MSVDIKLRTRQYIPEDSELLAQFVKYSTVEYVSISVQSTVSAAESGSPPPAHFSAQALQRHRVRSLRGRHKASWGWPLR
jgi:hypothetical protein